MWTIPSLIQAFAIIIVGFLFGLGFVLAGKLLR